MKLFKIIFLIAVIGLTAKSYGQYNCRNAVSLQNNSNITTPLNTDVFWCNIVPENDSMIYTLSTNNNTTALIATVSLYKGGCDSVELINTYTVNDSSFYIELFNLQPNNNYFFKVNFNNTLNGNFIMYSIIVPYGTPCPNPSSCSLVKNYSFEYIRDSIDASYAFQSNQVCHWQRAWGSPSWSGIGYLNDGAPYMWSRENRTEAIFQGGMTLQPNVEYTITYDYLASTTDFSSINVGLSNFTLPTTIISDVDPPPSGFTMYPIGTINLLTNPYSANTWYHYNSNLNLSFTPNSAYNNLVIYPLRPGINSPYVLVDNIVIKPKLIFQNLQSPQTIGCNSITMQPLVPTISNIDSWEWTSNQSGSAILATTQNFQVSPSVNTIYTVTAYTHTATGEIECQWTGSFTVNVNAIHPIVNAGNDATICLGNNITIGGNPTASGAPAPFTYYWTISNVSYVSNLPNPVVSPTISITYTVIATSSNGCSGTDNVTIIVNSVPAAVPVIIGNHNNCDLTTTYTIETPGANSVYTWAFTPTNPDATGSISGQGTPTITVDWNDPNGDLYMGTLTVTNNENGCTSTSSIDIYRCCSRFHPGYDAIYGSPYNVNSTTDMPSGDFYIDGTVILDCNCNIMLNQQEVKFGPLAQIVVKPGTTFTVNESHLSAGCDFMWDGIHVSDPSSEVDIIGNSEIKYAINGIVASNNAKLNIKDAKFSRNLCSININDYVPQTDVISIKANNFSGGGMLVPCANAFDKIRGIKLYNANNITIGDATAQSQNTFDNMVCGIYSLNSYTKIYANSFTNIQGYIPLIDKKNYLILTIPTAIYSCHSLTGSITPKTVEIGGSTFGNTLGNTFDNCQNGIGVYNEKATISTNTIKAIDNGIYITDPLSNTFVSNNIISRCSNGYYPLVGMRILKLQPSPLNLTVKNNIISSREKGIYIGNCKSSRSADQKPAYVDIMSNTITMYNGDNTKTGILTENCLAIFIKCNTVGRIPAALPSESAAVKMFGISINNTQYAEIQENTISYMGAGINVYGIADLTKFNCNTLNANFYGFLFNQQASITKQGSSNNRTDNKFMPDGVYSGIYGGQPVERKFWALNSNLPDGTPSHPAIKWYYYNDNSYLFNPQNNTMTNPTKDRIIISPTASNASSSCTIDCTHPHIGTMTIEEREEMFGAIVRDEIQYDTLEKQYKAYNYYVLYQTLSENNDIMYLGGADDYMYQAFYADKGNGSIGAFDELETLIAEGNIDQAAVKVNLIQDTSLIVDNQKTVDEIYLGTFALDNYELTDDQREILFRIATHYTPWEGGEGVYIARYMLGIEINTDDNPNVQFAKRPGKAEPAEMLTTFPNPVTDNLCLSFNKAIEGGFVINVYNYAGLSVLTQIVSQTETQHYLNVSKLTNGIYFFTVKTNINTYKGKFTVIK